MSARIQHDRRNSRRLDIDQELQVQAGTAPWVDGSRETLRLATIVRKGGLNYLQ